MNHLCTSTELTAEVVLRFLLVCSSCEEFQWGNELVGYAAARRLSGGALVSWCAIGTDSSQLQRWFVSIATRLSRTIEVEAEDLFIE